MQRKPLKMTYLPRGDEFVEVLITEFPGRDKNKHKGDLVLSIIGLYERTINKDELKIKKIEESPK